MGPQYENGICILEFKSSEAASSADSGWVLNSSMNEWDSHVDQRQPGEDVRHRRHEDETMHVQEAR
jgi:hypothetical protein